MKKYIVIGLFLTILLVPGALASTHCACSRINTDPGLLTGFDCSWGEADNNNLSFYVEDEPVFGETYVAWALKDLDGNTLIAKNLNVTVSIDGQERYVLTTDDNGYFEFDVDTPGEYEICGGDATLSFNITDPDAVVEPEVNDTEGITFEENQMLKENDSVEDMPKEIVDKPDEKQEVIEIKKGNKDTKADDFPYIYLVIVLVAIVALIFYKKKK